MLVRYAEARDHLTAWVTAAVEASSPQVLNVTGPLGIGKSLLLAQVPTSAGMAADGRFPLVIDGIDSDRDAEAAARLVARTGRGPVLVGSRGTLAARPGWAGRSIASIDIAPWSLAETRALVATLGVVEPAQIELVVRLAGGIPLIADSLCRAIRGGAGTEVIGSLADAAATDVLRRLGTESSWMAAQLVPVVATLDGADEDLLSALVRLPVKAFDRLRAFSVVHVDRHGLTVAEPYRSLLDLAYRWRRPTSRVDLTTRGAALRDSQLANTTDRPLRARLADQILYLSASRQTHRDLHAEVTSEFTVRRADVGDDPAIAGLIRRWAAEEGLSTRRADAMLDLWMAGTDHGFHLAVDADDHPVGMVNLVPMTTTGAPALEPLLQQHAAALTDSEQSGTVVGMMAVEPGCARAQPVLVRHIIATAISNGRLIVSTPWIPYQQMAARFTLPRLGETTDDIYRCGHPSVVYARTFTSESLPAWLRHMQGLKLVTPDQTVELVRAALPHLHAPSRLAGSPLTALSGAASPESLAAILRHAIDDLAASAATVDSQAGQILHLYYVRRAAGHDMLAHQLHVSRATYFRRLEFGINALAHMIAHRPSAS